MTPHKATERRRIGSRSFRERGFTLIELITAVVILGIVAAAAYSRLVTVAPESHKAMVGMTARSFASSIQLAQMSCTARNGKASLNVPGYYNNTVDFNANCFPVGTGATAAQVAGNGNVNATRCMQVWTAILDPAPAISTAATGTTDYRAQNSGTTTCLYTYRKDTSVTRSFTYSLVNGRVVATNP